MKINVFLGFKYWYFSIKSSIDWSIRIFVGARLIALRFSKKSMFCICTRGPYRFSHWTGRRWGLSWFTWTCSKKIWSAASGIATTKRWGRRLQPSNSLFLEFFMGLVSSLASCLLKSTHYFLVLSVPVCHFMFLRGIELFIKVIPCMEHFLKSCGH